ncbi:MAG TPA: MgtC/SapB family protein [Candidatus Sulfotelmatobacter sp.]|nr:MgtC/SapB family protein [Candidatus Sulfotelmatobacter sp.]
MNFYNWLPPEAVQIVLVLFLSFLIGLEREEHKTNAPAFSFFYSFGGVRTFPLIGFIGYSIAMLSGTQLLPVAIGFLVIGAFLLLSYWHKLAASAAGGVTSEMSGLTTYLVGALIFYNHYWIATALSVASLLLLELKTVLERLASRTAPQEILTFAKFLLLSAVILPILPNQDFTPFHLNPFKTWLVVVAVSAVSYGSYVLQKVTKEHGGVVLAAFLGGAYSSTVATVAMSRRAKREQRPHLFAGGILIASGVMYLRLVALLTLFNRHLGLMLAPAFLALAAVAIVGGLLWSRRPDVVDSQIKREFEPNNPLELLAAFAFALFFLAMIIATQLAATYLGHAGVRILAAVMGVTDVDPFIMGMTQAAGTLTPFPVAASAVLIAAASNNLIKGIYSYFFADRKTAMESLPLLGGLAAAGLLPLLWL